MLFRGDHKIDRLLRIVLVYLFCFILLGIYSAIFYYPEIAFVINYVYFR